MKFFIVCILTSFLFSNSCWKIKDLDEKAYCESIYEGKKSCWRIKNNDKKSMCEAEAYGKHTCWKIRNNDLRAVCESMVNKQI